MSSLRDVPGNIAGSAITVPSAQAGLGVSRFLLGSARWLEAQSLSFDLPSSIFSAAAGGRSPFMDAQVSDCALFVSLL
jgi:hypothetical protein